MNRRDTVKLLAVGAAFWLTPSDVRRAAEFAAKARSGGRGYEPKFFTPHEWETVRVLVDLVIPRDGCRRPRVHGLRAHRRARAPDRDAWRARLAGPRVRRSLRQDLRGLRGRRARRRARRHRVAQEGQIRSRPWRRVLQRFPRPDGIGVLVQQDGRAGPPLHGQRGRARMEGMPGRTAEETRREVPVVRRGKGEGSMPEKRLGVGFIGSGFNARFHLQAFQAVRDADVLGVWSPNRQHAEEMAALARRLDVGEAKAFPSIAQLVTDPAIDAVWLCGPNFARVANGEEIADTIARGKGALKGIACEKPLARNVAEAKRVAALVTEAGIAHGYLENQAFAPAVTQGRAITWARGASLTGRPYLARAAEEHSGPHMPWFWRGELQGGGVLNDMMCHSALVVRHLLTKPGAPSSSVRPVRVTGHIASLKWTRPEYAKRLQQRMGKDVDYTTAPAEDFASVMIEFAAEDGATVLGEATTSWSFVGPGLRLSAELLGPEYSMAWNSLRSE